jgi:hypothetical protein
MHGVQEICHIFDEVLSLESHALVGPLSRTAQAIAKRNVDQYIFYLLNWNHNQPLWYRMVMILTNWNLKVLWFEKTQKQFVNKLNWKNFRSSLFRRSFLTCRCGHETSRVGSSSSGSNSELSLGGNTRNMFFETIRITSGYIGSTTAPFVAVT